MAKLSFTSVLVAAISATITWAARPQRPHQTEAALLSVNGTEGLACGTFVGASNCDIGRTCRGRKGEKHCEEHHLAEGKGCEWWPVGGECADGLHCTGNGDDKKCRKVKDGDPCEWHASGHECPSGFLCLGASGRKQCRAESLGAGEACEYWSAGSECQSGFTCGGHPGDKKCIEGKDGDPCEWHASGSDCDSGLKCRGGSGKKYCRKEKLGLGEACEWWSVADSECQSGKCGGHAGDKKCIAGTAMVAACVKSVVEGFVPWGDAVFGCPKCRSLANGCLACNPWKVVAKKHALVLPRLRL